MAEKTDLFFMPLYIEALWRAEMDWSSDARLLYRLLLEVQWLKRGILPKDLKKLQKVTRLADWRAPRFRAAFAEIQAEDDDCWEEPKFKEDRWGLYNAKGRKLLRDIWEPKVVGHKGSLKQWGCSFCKARDVEVKLGDGWIRECPECGTDLWPEYEDIPWLPELLPARLAVRSAEVVDRPQEGIGAGPLPPPLLGGQGGDLKPNRDPNPEDRQAFCLAIETVAGEVLDSARPFSAEEGQMVMSLADEGIPPEVAVRTIRDIARREKQKNPRKQLKSVKYFLQGRAGGAIREAWQHLRALQEPDLAAAEPPASDAAVAGESEEWTRILAALQAALSHQEYTTWFQHLSVVKSGPNSVVIQVPNTTILGIIQADFSTALDQARGTTTVELKTPEGD